MMRFVIDGQKLRLLGNPYIVGNSHDYLTASFQFFSDPDWEATEKHVFFKLGTNNPYEIILVDDTISKDKHLNLSDGIWSIYIIGYDINDGTLVERIPTNKVSLLVEESGIEEGEPFPDVGGSTGEQILASEQDRIDQELTRVAAEDVRVTAESGRDSAEGLRDTAEGLRDTAEDSRVIAESARAFYAAYDADTSYVLGNKVSYNGSSYIWTDDDPSVAGTQPPNTGWLLIASRGEDGIDGVSGVYVGSDPIPEGYNVQIDPDGDATDVVLQFGTMPTADADYLGTTVLYTGTTGTYKNGGTYICVASEDPTPVYSWSRVGEDVSGAISTHNTDAGAHADKQTKAITDVGNYFATDTVEDALQEIGSDVSVIQHGNVKLALTDWEIGSFLPGNGATQSSTTRIRSQNYHQFLAREITITPEVGYKFIVYEYGVSNVFIGATSWSTIALILKINYAHSYKFLISNTSDGTATVEFADHVSFIVDSDQLVKYPAYYDAHLQSKINSIRATELLCGRSSSEFLFLTDIHDNTMYLRYILSEIIGKTNTKIVINNGDMSADGTIDLKASRLRAIDELMSDFAHYNVIGNHEDNRFGTGLLTSNELYCILQKQQENRCVYSDLETHDYYFDNVAQKIRYIVYDSSADAAIGLSNDQMKWVANTALDIGTGWSVIVITHAVYAGASLQYYANAQTTDLLDILAAFHSGGSYISVTYDINKDYSLKHGSVIAVFSGHTHSDRVIKTHGVTVVVTDCDIYSLHKDYSDVLISGTALLGTYREHCFDAVNIDLTNRIVYCDRIGYGANRKIHVADIAITHPNTVALISTLAGTLTWTSTNTAIATVAAGTVTSVSVGTVQISASDTSGNMEFWSIVVSN